MQIFQGRQQVEGKFDVVGDEDWFKWLATGVRCFSIKDMTLGKAICVKDINGYWIARRDLFGKQRQMRLGKDEFLTYENIAFALKTLGMSDLGWYEYRKSMRDRLRSKRTIRLFKSDLLETRTEKFVKISALERVGISIYFD